MEKRKTIESNAIIVFNRDVLLEELKAIPKDFKGDVIIYGNLYDDPEVGMFHYDPYEEEYIFEFGGNIWLYGALKLMLKGTMRVSEDFYLLADEDSEAFNIEIGGNFLQVGDIDFEARDITVGKDLSSIGDTTWCTSNIKVGGKFTCDGYGQMVASSIETDYFHCYGYGSVYANGDIKDELIEYGEEITPIGEAEEDDD